MLDVSTSYCPAWCVRRLAVGHKEVPTLVCETVTETRALQLPKLFNDRFGDLAWVYEQKYLVPNVAKMPLICSTEKSNDAKVFKVTILKDSGSSEKLVCYELTREMSIAEKRIEVLNTEARVLAWSWSWHS